MTRNRTTHVILDRDGVLNEEAPNKGYIRSPEEWRWIPGSLEALSLLSRGGLRVSVATNQSGVGRGIMTSADLALVHAHMLSGAAEAGGSIDAVFTCPHAPGEGCHCRKPAPGLIEAAIEASRISSAETLVIGDDLRDLEAARAAGVGSALVLTGKGRATAARLSGRDVPVYDDLRAVARWLLAESGHGGDRRE